MNAAHLIQRLVAANAPADLIADVAMALARGEAAEQQAAERRAKDLDRVKRRQSMLPDNWLDLRLSIFERDNYTCKYCGDRDPQQWHCDHIVPLSRGGDSQPSNLTTACGACNSSKGGRMLSEWGGRSS